eukprot:8129964-Pyramimonas_sp.AAC.1
MLDILHRQSGAWTSQLQESSKLLNNLTRLQRCKQVAWKRNRGLRGPSQSVARLQGVAMTSGGP